MTASRRRWTFSLAMKCAAVAILFIIAFIIPAIPGHSFSAPTGLIVLVLFAISVVVAVREWITTGQSA